MVICLSFELAALVLERCDRVGSFQRLLLKFPEALLQVLLEPPQSSFCKAEDEFDCIQERDWFYNSASWHASSSA